MFGIKLCVFEFAKEKWDTQRTPEGIGYRIDLCSTFDRNGKLDDSTDQFITKHVEQPAVNAIKALANGEELGDGERRAMAAFIAFTHVRSPDVMKNVIDERIAEFNVGQRVGYEIFTRQWCADFKRPYNPTAIRDYLKRDYLKAVPLYCELKERQLLSWKWHQIRTNRDQPFILSDRPLYAQWDDDDQMGVISFPVSPQVALLLTFGGDVTCEKDRLDQVRDMNKRTIAHAKEFVVGWKPSFPGDDILPEKVAILRSLGYATAS